MIPFTLNSNTRITGAMWVYDTLQKHPQPINAVLVRLLHHDIFSEIHSNSLQVNKYPFCLIINHNREDLLT